MVLKTGAGIYPKHNILHFNRQNVYLDNHNYSNEVQMGAVYLTELGDEEIEDEMCWELSKPKKQKLELSTQITLNKEQ